MDRIGPLNDEDVRVADDPADTGNAGLDSTVPQTARIWNALLGGDDNVPMVQALARKLLTSTVEGETAYLHADLREPETILERAAGTLDRSEPVAVMLMGVLGHIGDDAEAKSIIDRLLGPLPPGSYL